MDTPTAPTSGGGGGNTVNCGQPPYITGYSSVFEENAYGSYTWGIEIYTTDPEGGDVKFYNDNFVVNPIDSYTSCWISSATDQGEETWLSWGFQHNSAFIECWLYNRYGTSPSRSVEFYYTYNTEGCPSVNGYYFVQ